MPFQNSEHPNDAHENSNANMWALYKSKKNLNTDLTLMNANYDFEHPKDANSY